MMQSFEGRYSSLISSAKFPPQPARYVNANKENAQKAHRSVLLLNVADGMFVTFGACTTLNKVYGVSGKVPCPSTPHSTRTKGFFKPFFEGNSKNFGNFQGGGEFPLERVPQEKNTVLYRAIV